MTAPSPLLKPAVWAFYLIVGLEFLFMISPLGFFFYSSYGPLLNSLHAYPATAWLTGFFLPHVSFTDSELINSIKPWGFRIAGFGLLVFLIGVVQIYGAKLLRRKEVTGGLYRISRHPQYAALAILGFGVLLIWPRYLVLLSFVAMLFLYYLLARFEERRCLEKYGDSYRRYMERVGFFLPRFGVHGPRWPKWTRRPVVRFAAFLVLAIGAVLFAHALRAWSLFHVSSLYEDGVAVLSPAVLSSEEIGGAYRLAAAEPAVNEARANDAGGGPWIVYVVPAGWHLADLPLERWEEIPAEHRRGHTTPRDFDRSRYKVLFTRALTHHPRRTGAAIVTSAYGRRPVVRARVDLAASTVEAVESPPVNVVWGDIPTPMY